MHFEQICDRYGSDTCPVTIADYEEICVKENWPHGKFTEDDLGIYEDGKMIAERAFDVGDRVIITDTTGMESLYPVRSEGVVVEAARNHFVVEYVDYSDTYYSDGSDLELIK